MTLLLILAALLALVTVWFLARAVRRAPAGAEASYDGLVQLRDRLLAQLRELDVEEGDRNIDTAVAADERRRLESELAHALKALETVPGARSEAQGRSSSRLWVATVAVLAVVLPLASTALYLISHATVLVQLGEPGAAAGGDVPPMALEMVARLERRLAEQPDDPAGWTRLGRAYTVLGRVQEARQAYRRAYGMAPNDVEIVAAYADFLLAQDSAALSSEAVALYRKVHALEPRHPGALWWLGLASYQDKKFSEAVSFWEQLRRQLPPESEVEPQVRHAIEMARAEAAKAK